MKKNRTQQMIPLTDESDAIVERRKKQTGQTKRAIVNKLIEQAGRKWYPNEDAQ